MHPQCANTVHLVSGITSSRLWRPAIVLPLPASAGIENSLKQFIWPWLGRQSSVEEQHGKAMHEAPRGERAGALTGTVQRRSPCCGHLREGLERRCLRGLQTFVVAVQHGAAEHQQEQARVGAREPHVGAAKRLKRLLRRGCRLLERLGEALEACSGKGRQQAAQVAEMVCGRSMGHASRACDGAQR